MVYLNGTEVVRSNMPNGTISYLSWAASTVAGAEESTFFAFTVAPALLVAGTNVLAVEIHQRNGTSSDISFDLELTDVPLPMLTRTPYLQNGTPTSVVVRWRTRDLTDSLLKWGTSPTNLVNTVSSATPTQLHVLEITGLSPDSRYYYSVGDSTTTFAGGDIDHTFLTFPVAGTTKPTRIWVLGDSGTANANAAAVRDAYYSFAGTTHTDLWLMLGDNAYSNGSFSEYQAAVFDMYPEMLRKSTLYSTRGNHENSASVYYGQFTFPTAGEAGGMPSGSEAYYSFDYSNIHFVCLDSDASNRSVAGAMLTWLVSDLASTDQDWIVAFWHHPPYTKGSHDSDNFGDSSGRMFDMRQNALPILEDYGVDLVLNGHSHSYERSFLIDGHYGVSSTFDPATMMVDGGDGRETGTGVYAKTKAGHEGAVFAVAGSSGKTSGGPLNHPVMFTSLNQLGSVVIDVDGDRMDVSFLRSTGAVADWFTLTTREPGPLFVVQNLVAGQQATATVSYATPGNDVLLGWSSAGGGPTSTTYGDISMSPPINQLGPYTADLAGQVVVPINVPAGASGLSVWAQALELTGPGTGLLSNPLALIVQ